MKKYILGLFVGFVGLISFCSSVDVVLSDSKINHLSILNSESSWITYSLPATSQYYYLFSGFSCNTSNCFSFQCGYSSCKYEGYTFNTMSNSNFVGNSLIYSNGTCWDHCDLRLNSSVSVDFFVVDRSIPFPSTCSEVNTGEILSGYILESEINSGYCMNNNLCPESTGEITGLNRSELKINDIVHQSAPFINITIPQELDWDYTVDENEFDLSISGYNVDTDYIDGIITVQNSKPDVSDFNKIITDLIPLFVPGLVIILFLLFVFNLIKKIF